MHHHGGSLRQLTKDNALVEALLADPRRASLEPRWRALADVAITAYFNFVNRLAEGFHIPLE